MWEKELWVRMIHMILLLDNMTIMTLAMVF